MSHEQIAPPCEAPEHEQGCDGNGISMDHFTPECIAKLWGWTREEINSHENIQYLSKECHKAKDRTTKARYYLAILQKYGFNITLEDYQKIEDPDYHLPYISNERLAQCNGNGNGNGERKNHTSKHYVNGNGGTRKG